MSSFKTAKQQRLESASFAPGSENPCVRCIPYYGSNYGANGFDECRFPDLANPIHAHTAEGPDGDELAYFICYRCESSGQRCFEVAGTKYNTAKTALSSAIVDAKAANNDTASVAKVRNRAQALATKIDAFGKPHAEHFEAHSGANEGGNTGVVFAKRANRSRKSNPGNNPEISAVQKRSRADSGSEAPASAPQTVKKARVEASTPNKALEAKIRGLKDLLKDAKDEAALFQAQRDFLMEKANKNTKAAYGKKW